MEVVLVEEVVLLADHHVDGGLGRVGDGESVPQKIDMKKGSHEGKSTERKNHYQLQNTPSVVADAAQNSLLF